MSDTPRHSVSVAAAIFDDSGENVLLIKRRDNGRWEPPGGVLELDETIEEGLRREVREETGADVEVGQLSGVYKNMAQGIVALVARCRLRGDFLANTAEAQTVAWIPIGSVGSLATEAYAVRISDAAKITGVAIRNHDGVNLLDG